MINSEILPKINELAQSVEAELKDVFSRFDRISEENTAKVMSAYREFRVSDACFSGTTGYGYDDLGRDTLDKIYARVLGAESAIVRMGLVSGTHAITCALFAACEPQTTLLSVTGAPYDTLRGVIGLSEKHAEYGSLKYHGIGYRQVELLPDGEPDIEGIKAAAGERGVRAVFIQRSRGYSSRRAFSVEDIEKIIKSLREVNESAVIVVDNCYGEFTGVHEPCDVGADLIAGSLIKNPGGGLAPTGGYVAGRKELVVRAAARLTAPGIGGECGSTLNVNRLFFQGFFMAPHIVCQAMKTAAFCAGMMNAIGFRTSPDPDEPRNDIIQMIELGTPENLLKFCAGIQRGAPVDSFVTPTPWSMPGYDHDVVMAAGAFVQGSSIELSCDGPMREPYLAFMQGGLTYESGKLGVLSGISALLND